MLNKEGLTVSGNITIRSYPAGTIHLYETLVELGKHDQARELLAQLVRTLDLRAGAR